jgi:AcrR family transcriptional regulator
MICAGNNRRMQVRRKPRRKLFGKRAKEDFLEQLSCTGNVAAAAEAAGVTPGTVYNHRRKDPEFRQAFWLALEQSVAKLVALRLQREIERAERAGQAVRAAAGERPSTSLGTNGGGSTAPRANGEGLALRLDSPPDEKQIVDLIKLMQMLRDLCRNLSAEPGSVPARAGSNPLRAASAEEIVDSLEKGLKAFAKRRAAEARGRGDGDSHS